MAEQSGKGNSDKIPQKESKESKEEEKDKENEEGAGSKDLEVVELADEEAKDLVIEQEEDEEGDEFEDNENEEEKGKPAEKKEKREMNNTGVFDVKSEFVPSVAFNPTSPDIVAIGCGDNTCRIWSISTGKELNCLTGIFVRGYKEIGHNDTVSFCKFSCDGSRLCTASLDNTLKIWKGQSPYELMGTLEGPSDEIHFIQWHSKGNVILCGSEDGSMWMFDGDKCEYMNTFTGHHGGVKAGGFTADGKNIYSVGNDGTLRIWQPKKAGGEPEIIKATTKTETIGGYTAACCHPTKPVILAGSDIGTLVMALYTTHKIAGTMRISAKEEYIETVAASSVCENFACCGTNEGSFHIIDISVPKIRNTNTLNEVIVKAQFSKKDETVFAGTGDGKIYRIDARSGTVVQQFIGPPYPVLDFDISPYFL